MEDACLLSTMYKKKLEKSNCTPRLLKDLKKEEIKVDFFYLQTTLL